MTDTAAQAQRISRETAPTLVNLSKILAAEEHLAAMTDDDFSTLCEQVQQTPKDPYLHLWFGLAARQRGKFADAIAAFSQAIDLGCVHWRIGWYIAQAARAAGQVEVVDQACAAVLQANPKFWFARELPKHARGYYSQIGQDKIVEEFFAHVAPRTKVFVEVGAFDGVHYSNVRRLHEQHGWTGISFEPVSKNFKKLAAAYAGTAVKCVQSAVSTSDGMVEINVSTYPHLPEWGSDVATLGAADTARWEREFGATWTKEQVPVRRLTRLLDDAGIRDFDFISIDTEGHDLEVIRSIDFDRYHPQMIVVEYGEHRAAILQHLEKQGYSLLCDNTQDLIMARVQHQPCADRMVPDTVNFGHVDGRSAPAAVVHEMTERLASWIWREASEVRNLVIVAPDGPVPFERLLRHYPSAMLHVVQPGALKLPASPRIRIHRTLGALAKSVEDTLNLLWCFKAETLPSLSPEEKSLLEIVDALVTPFAASSQHAGSEGGAWGQIDTLAHDRGCYLAAVGFSPKGDGSGIGAWLRLPPKYENPATTLDELHARFARLQGCRATYTNGTTFGMGQLYQGFERIGVKGQRSTERRQEIYGLEKFLLPTDRLLDIGCNCGFMSMSLAHRVREVRGIDADRAVIAIAREAARYLRLDNCIYEVQPFHAFDPAERFDVICSFAVHHWLGVSFADYVKRLWTMLNPGGRLIFESHDLRTTDRDLEAKLGLLGQAGFRLRHHGELFENQNEYPRLFFVFEKPVPVSGASDPRLKKINPHLLTILPAESFGGTRDYAPAEALSHRRFDVVAKFIYARHRELGLDLTWSRALYCAHIQAFNGGREGDGSGKDSIEKFVDAFDQVLDSLKATGFDSKVSLLPISSQSGAVIDGGHRAAGCLLHGLTAQAIEVDYTSPVYDWSFFQSRGLALHWCDAIASETTRINPRLRLLVAMAPDLTELDSRLAVAPVIGAVHYRRVFTLNGRGVANLRHELGADKASPQQARACYAGAVLVEPGVETAPVSVPAAAAETNAPAEAPACWLTETHEETTIVAGLVFNEQGIAFLNFADPSRDKARMALAQTLAARFGDAQTAEWVCSNAEAALALAGVPAFVDPTVWGDGRLAAELTGEFVTNPAKHFVYRSVKFPAIELAQQLVKEGAQGVTLLQDAVDRFISAAPPLPRGIPFSFSNNWFKAHEQHWNELLIPWARARQPLNILEIGVYEGRSSCWFITELLGDDRSRLTSVDPWKQASSIRVYDDNMEEVFETFQHNVRVSGRSSQVSIVREESNAALRSMADRSFDLVYIDGDHGAEGVYADTLEAYRVLKDGGMILWDDYYWCDTVRAGVDRACAELGVNVVRFGNNASFEKAQPAKAAAPRNKIVGLIPSRNEAMRLPFCLRALTPYVDAIVYLDDCSDDDSVRVVESLAAECHVEEIIRKTDWHRDEPGDRNRLLEAGRRIGGTHFIVLDVDEAFTANCAQDDYLRRLVLALQPGDSLALSWIQLWRSLKQYRFDKSHWTFASKAFAFCDDRAARYESGFIHTQRVPGGLRGKMVNCVNYTHGVMHFQFVDWPNLQIKQAWYRCMERVRQPGRSTMAINQLYAPAEDETGLGLRDAPAAWFEGYANLDAATLAVRDDRRIREVLGWFAAHGTENFAGLDIWRVPWEEFTSDAKLADDIRAQKRRGVSPFTLSPTAQQQVTIAGQHFTRGEMKACREAFERALAAAPGHAEILGTLGNLLLISDQLPAAKKRFEESLAVDPHQPKVWSQLAAAHRKSKNIRGFEGALERALNLDPDCIEALRLTTETHLERHRPQCAVAPARRLATLAPRDATIQLLVGRALLAAGETEEATKAFKTVQQLAPSNAAAADALTRIARARTRQAPRTSSSSRPNSLQPTACV